MEQQHAQPRASHLRIGFWSLCGGIAVIFLVAVPAAVLAALPLWWGMIDDGAYRAVVAAGAIIGCALACLAVMGDGFLPPDPERGRGR